MVAEAGRPPFDLAEAEGELVGGFNTEYSGMRFGMFMLAEFMNVVTMSAIVVTLFLGGPVGSDLRAARQHRVGHADRVVLPEDALHLLLHPAAGRPAADRYDKLMNLGWKVLIPVALVWTW
jgi:NADH-quinone oxidoreductase subunit H